MLVFRATPGVGGDMYSSWMKGVFVTTDDITCMTTDVTTCNHHYRNPIVDSWTSIGMAQVKLALYKSNVKVAYIIFHAVGSDVTSWFSGSRIAESPWATIKSDTFNFFSINVHAPSRRFMINLTHGGCSVDTGYMVVVGSGHFGCNYDVHDSYPKFLYANSATYGSFGTLSGVDKADVMAIFIK